MKLQKRSIRSHLITNQSTVTGLVLLLCVTGFIATDIQTFKRHIDNSLLSTTKMLGMNLLPTLSFSDPGVATKILSSLKAEPMVKGAELYDKEGKIFAKYGEASSNGFIYRLPLALEGDFLGTLVISADSSILWNQVRSYSFIAFLVFVVALIATFFLAQVSQRSLSKPIEYLAYVTKKISDSGDYRLRVAHGSDATVPTEILNLSEEFDRMVGVVQMKERFIVEANQNLEKKVEERTAELFETNQMLFQASKMSSLGELAGGIAHEINNPLATVKLVVEQIQSLLEEEPLDKPALTERTSTLLGMISRIEKIIKGMLVFARGGEQAPLEKAKVSEIVANALFFCAERFRQHGVKLEVSPVPDDWVVEGRGNQLSQVILNLLNNAHDAIAGLSEKWIRLEVKNEGDYIVRVTNSGPKIPDEIRQKLFKPFFTTKAAGKGTGLGLSVSRRIISDHQGELSVDEKCPNTCFVIRLPSERPLQMAA